MKRAILISLLGALVLGAPVSAQEGSAPASGVVTDAMSLTRAVIQTERQAIVAANMELTEPESEAFWPLYREYRQAMAKVGDRLATLITDYAKSYTTMTDLQAEDMVKEMMDIHKKQPSVRSDYLKKFKKILPAKKVARFYQIENKLDAVINYELANEIPLVRTK